ncbi:MAG TPA: sigma-70 family RNA polymerase sigma factor [Vicinamibacteria bacterium]|jgi:RNA polymerase sigma-70 factor (ECF subfamily)|nr:sigma-70 family RNA polymerase sigma factor [Vicinamibacteria bacterium]
MLAATMTLPERARPAPEVAEEVLRHFREQGAALYRFSLTLVRNPADAEDVVQETFLKLLRHLQERGPDANLRGWLFTVAAHACRDRQRLRIRWRPWAPAYDSAVPPVDAAAEAEEQQIALTCLQRLPERDRLLLALRAQGLSYREIGAATGIKTTSVGTLLARALQRWERACREHGGRPSS